MGFSAGALPVAAKNLLRQSAGALPAAAKKYCDVQRVLYLLRLRRFSLPTSAKKLLRFSGGAGALPAAAKKLLRHSAVALPAAA